MKLNDSKKISSAEWSCLGLFAVIFLFPLQWQAVKLVLLASTMLCLVFQFHERRVFVDKRLMNLTIYYTFIGFLFVAYAFVLQTPGVSSLSRIFVGYPLVFFLLAITFQSQKSYMLLLKLLVTCSLLIALNSIYMVAYSRGVVGYTPLVDLNSEFIAGFHDGYVQTVDPKIYTLLFSVPFMVSAVILDRGRAASVFSIGRPLLFSALGLSLIAGLLSGRRSLWIAIVLSSVLTQVLSLYTSGQRSKDNFKLFGRVVVFFVIGMFFVIGFVVVFDLDLVGLQDRLAGAIFGTGLGFQVRSAQSDLLIGRWLEAPWFGNGIGYVAEYSLKDGSPWLYEIFYHSFLSQVGIIGFSLYFIGLFWWLKKLVWFTKLGRVESMYIVPTIIALMCFLMASGTNPYLLTFDGIWPLFLSISVLNIIYRAQRR